MKKILWSFFIFILAIVSAMALLKDDPSFSGLSNDEPMVQKISIAVSQTPLSAPLFVAHRNGYFKQQGLDVELVACNGGVICSQMLFDNKVDLATASESVVMFTSFERDDFSVLASFVESDNDLKLLTLSNLGFNNINDLVSKKVGVMKASSSEFYLDSLLIINNIPSSEIQKINLLPTEAIDALLSGHVEAISIWEPYGYQLKMHSQASIINLGLPGIYQLSFNLLTSSKISNDQQASIKLLRAIEQAIVWIEKNRNSAIEITSNALDIEPEQLKWSWNDLVFRLSLGNTFLSNLQMQARWAHNLGLVQGPIPDFRRYLESDIFEQATNPGN